MGQHLIRALRQIAQQIQFLGGEMYTLAFAGNGAGIEIDQNFTHANLVRGGLRARHPSEGRPYPRHQFRRAERFGHKIVRSRIKSGYFVCFRIADSEHDDRDVAIPAYRPARFQSAHPGHVHIEYDKIWTQFTNAFERFLARLGLGHLVSFRYQRRAHDATNFRLVIDDHDAAYAHAASGRRTGSVMRNVVWPGRLETVSSPLWASTIACVMLKPRPDPGI